VRSVRFHERVAWLCLVTGLILSLWWVLERVNNPVVVPGEVIHLEKLETEDQANIQAALDTLEGFCGTEGLPAEVWVERTTEGLELLGRCTATFRQGP
jgi:hypothetical protein